MKKSKFIPVGLFLLALAAVTLVACGDAGPREHSFVLTIANQEIVYGDVPLSVTQGDQVVIQVNVDEPMLFHLHGYDIEREASLTDPAIIDFVADATGSFPFTVHSSGQSNGHSGHGGSSDQHQSSGHGDIFSSPVLSPGDVFEFALPINSDTHPKEGYEIPFHSHLYPSVSGTIRLLDEAEPSTMELEIKDQLVVPTDIEVGHGSTVIWANNDSVSHMLVSGIHPGGEVVESDMGHHNGHDADMEEIELGRLEVLP